VLFLRSSGGLSFNGLFDTLGTSPATGRARAPKDEGASFQHLEVAVPAPPRGGQSHP
jgi:hypothetical protein